MARIPIELVNRGVSDVDDHTQREVQKRVACSLADKPERQCERVHREEVRELRYQVKKLRVDASILQPPPSVSTELQFFHGISIHLGQFHVHGECPVSRLLVNYRPFANGLRQNKARASSGVIPQTILGAPSSVLEGGAFDFLRSLRPGGWVTLNRMG